MHISGVGSYSNKVANKKGNVSYVNFCANQNQSSGETKDAVTYGTTANIQPAGVVNVADYIGMQKMQITPPPAIKEWIFLYNATTVEGAKFTRTSDGKGTDAVTLYSDNDTVYAKYKIVNGKIKEKTLFLDGKPDSVTKYWDNGQEKTTKLFGIDKNIDVIIQQDENGKYLDCGIAN